MYESILFSTFLSVLATVSCVDKEVCDYADEVCVTNAADRWYKLVSADNKLWELDNIEEVYEKTINANLPHDINYTFANASLYGMKHCTVHILKFDKDLSWYYYLIFPRLTFKADYVENGVVDSVPIEGKGKIVITYENNHVGTKGEVETIIASDGKQHINITVYKIDFLDARDKAHYKFTTSFSTDKEKSEKAHKYLNDNWKKVNNAIMYPTMKPFVDNLSRQLNKVLAIVPKYEVFYKPHNKCQ